MGINSSLDFYYNGQWASNMGVISVNTQDSGLFQEPFVADREIKEVIIRHRKKPYYQRLQDMPLTLNIRVTFENPYDQDSIRKITRWLYTDQYKELYFSDNLNRRFFAVYVGSNPQLMHNGLGEGYITLPFRCDAPYSYSPEYVSNVYDFSTSGSGTISFANDGDLSCFPEMWITKFGVDNGDIKVINSSNGGTIFQFTTASKARGKIIFTGTVADGQTVTIGNDVYEFDTNSSVTSGHIAINVATNQSASNASSQLTSIINNTTTKSTPVTATYNSSDSSVSIVYNNVGSLGNVAVATTCTNANWSGNTTLTGGQDGLMDQEQVYIHNENQTIISSLSNTYRYDAFNYNFLELVEGMNYLQVSGNCQIKFRYRYLTVQG